MDIQLSDNVDRISRQEFADVIEAAPFGKRDLVKIETAFRNSEILFLYNSTATSKTGGIK